MIKNIKLKNFQSHINSDIKLSKNVTAIVGSTDSGKSSIIRALKLISTNRPSGSKYINNSKKEASVEVETDKGTVKIQKTKTKKKYIINEEELTALKTDVPIEVTNTLGFDSTNIQAQQDVWFLINKSSGFVSKSLNEISGLEIVDSALKEANSCIRKINSDIRANNSNLEEIEERLDKLNWVNSSNSFLTKLENYENSTNNYENKVSTLIELSNNITRVNDEIDKLFSAQFESIVEKIVLYKSDTQSDEIKIADVSIIVDRIHKVTNELDSYSNLTTKNLETYNHSIEMMSTSIDNIINVCQAIKCKNKEISTINKEIEYSEIEVTKKLKVLGNCPTCGAAYAK